MAGNLPHVVVGFDGSVDADAALEWAARTAEPREQSVEVVIVATGMDPLIGGYRDESDLKAELRRAQAYDRLKDLGVTHSSVRIEHGPVGPELVRAAGAAGLLVVGSRGHGLATGALMGSVSQHVARHARCTVVVVRPARSPHARRIIVGVDGSTGSDRALRFAAARARQTGEYVVAVHGHHSMRDRMFTLDGAESEKELRRVAGIERSVAEMTAAVCAEFPDVEIGRELVAERPDQLLVACSAAASLVVVGSRGRDALTELLLGSVSQHVLHHAACPVAVVR